MRKILITIGIVLILIVLGAGFVVYKNGGVPKSADEVFGTFGRNTETPEFEQGDDEDDSVYEDAGDMEGTGVLHKLRQLTTRPVAGAVITSSGMVRFVERGTGHVYEMGLGSGSVEQLISGTTQPKTIRAEFATTGTAVVLTREEGSALVSVLGTLSGANGLEITALPEGATEVGFSQDGKDLDFFVPNSQGGNGYAYSLEKKTTRLLFSIPLSHVHVLWGTPTYVYTKPSSKAMGYAYRMGQGGSMGYVTEGAKGLVLMSHASGTLVSALTDKGAFVTKDVKYGTLPILTMFTEKCSRMGAKSRFLVCGSPTELPNTNIYPDDWYKGTIGLNDLILMVDAASSSVSVLSNLEKESGRPIDVLDIGTDTEGTSIHFINKYDNALWLLDLR